MNETKEHILKIALKLFLQKNFKEVTMKDIVEKTGLSKGAFYHYFESKEKLFEEIITLFLNSMLNPGYDNFENMSLHEYCQARIKGITGFTAALSENSNNSVESFFNMNFFSLIFDALKLFPEFRTKMKDYHHKELNEWISVIGRARATGEISSIMNDKQIAMLFMYTSDGLAMNLTLDDNMKNMETEIKSLWDKLYESIKA